MTVLISKKIDNKEISRYRKIVDSFTVFNNANSRRCNKLKFIEFSFVDGGFLFEQVDY